METAHELTNPMNDEQAIDWRTKGGQAKSAKKKRACRKNARLPRPGRKAFNAAVRDVLANASRPLSNEERGYMIDGIKIKYSVDETRAALILDTAIKRQTK